MLPKKNQKQVTRRPVKKRAVFDQGKPLKSDKAAAKRKKNAMVGVVMRLALMFVSFITLVGGVYAFYKVRAFDQKLASTITQIKNVCKNYTVENPLHSLLFITLNPKKQFQAAEYVVYDKEKKYIIDFTDVTFDIDKGGTQGTLKNYIDNNNIFLDEDVIFMHLSNLFLRDFLLKVDHIIVSEEGYEVSDFIGMRRLPLTTKLQALDKEYQAAIKTDICRPTWNTFIADYTAERRIQKEIGYSSRTKITDLFYFGDIKKEQIRIHLKNKTGVEHWGRFLAALFENYGMNVVKIDNDTETSVKSKIYIDDASLQTSATLNQLEYLTNNLNENPVIDNKGSIYSDIDIEVGQDFLIR